MKDIIKVEYSISTNIYGSTCSGILEFDREEWDEMDESEREEIMRDAAFDNIEWEYQELDSDLEEE